MRPLLTGRGAPTRSGTTLSDPELDKAEGLDPFEVVRPLSEEIRGEEFLDDGADDRKGEVRTDPFALDLQEVVGDRGEDDVMLPARVGAPFEVIEAELGLELLVCCSIGQR